MERRLTVGLIGAGHFGRFHALKLAAGPRVTFVGLADPDLARAQAVAGEAGCPVLTADAVLARAEAVVIAAPAEHHYALAKRALEAGRHVLVEKPVAATLDEAAELTALARTKNLVLQVGHLERFSAAYAAVTRRMGQPLYIEAVRIAPFKPRGTDVSVILDLMIHDLDLVLALVAAPIARVEAVGAAVASQHEDIANARIAFANGAVATITASRISLKTERKMRIFSQSAYLTVDFAARQLTTIGRDVDTKIPGLEEFGLDHAVWEDHDSLAAEHAAFVASVLDGAPVAVDGEAGARALDAALRVAAAIAESRRLAEASGLVPG